MRSTRHPHGFTLIELLIVVAIIAILAAIAVPNFLEAQTRSKVTRCKADLRTLAIGLGAYVTDYNDYPFNIYSYAQHDYNSTQGTFPGGTDATDFRRGMTVAACCWRLTTPVAYLGSVSSLGSPFWVNTGQTHHNWTLQADGTIDTYSSATGNTYWFGANKAGALPTTEVARYRPEWYSSGMLKQGHTWFAYGPGPRRVFEEVRVPPSSSDPYVLSLPPLERIATVYDPTNGTVSRGEILYSGF